MHHLSIDIETYSSVDIKTAGMYKYAQSPDFEILLFAFALDDHPVAVLDLASGETLPPQLIALLEDPNTIKHAYNASFEWYCLSRYFGRRLPLDQWRCTMLHGLYCGYPRGLDAVGQALGLPEDKQKLAVGKALIRYFCTPCKPTKTNGGRTRNLPKHDPDRWNLFKTYNAQDVVTEMEVARRLRDFPVPDAIQGQWLTDQIINARGVAVDMDLVAGALWCGGQTRAALLEEAKAVTGLDNPNSLQQLIRWLNMNAGTNIKSLNKETVNALLDDNSIAGAPRRMLEIRQELGKTSLKKYDALANTACADGRARGVLLFYGANRTGRWSGRAIQPQNLPRTYIDMLPFARKLVKSRQADALHVVYGSVPDTLSQLIRTAIIATPGNVLVDADFSAIEARVIAWLAGEEWRLEVFRTHGKIYEASASQMFGVPIEKIKKGNPEYALRQKGKVAELALGYQGGKGSLISMGALKMGLTEDELPEIVQLWRANNRRICDMWYAMESAAVSAIQTGRPTIARGITFTREYCPATGLDFLTITLPNRRKLYYAQPHLAPNKWGKDSLHYMGNDNGKWAGLDTYGGKLVENIVQAIARDCLAEAITRLEAAGYPVVFHVHDEVVIDCPKDKASLEDVIRIMAQPVNWARDLPLNADGWIDMFFKKD